MRKRLELYYATDQNGWGFFYDFRPRWDANEGEFMHNILLGYELARKLDVKPGECKKVTIIVKEE